VVRHWFSEGGRGRDIDELPLSGEEPPSSVEVGLAVAGMEGAAQEHTADEGVVEVSLVVLLREQLGVHLHARARAHTHTYTHESFKSLFDLKLPKMQTISSQHTVESGSKLLSHRVYWSIFPASSAAATCAVT
jgi:hypothetical protein